VKFNSVKTLGLVVKLAGLGLINGFAMWAIPLLMKNHTYGFAAYFIFSTLVLDVIFFSKRKFIPAKYIAPGVLLLLLFQVYPSIYTGYVAFTNYSTGHIIDKKTAIDEIISNSYQATGNGASIPMQVAKDQTSGALTLLLNIPGVGVEAGTSRGATPIPKSDVTLDSQGNILTVAGYKILSADESSNQTDAISAIKVPGPNHSVYVANDYVSANQEIQTLSYDSSKDTITDSKTGDVYKPDSNGEMKDSAGNILQPGWTANVGWRNFSYVIHDKTFRQPLLDVILWTFTFAFLVVSTTFFAGLLLGLALNHPKLRAKKIYRSLLIIPYAMPGVLSALVWVGMYNQDSGVINRMFGSHIPWLTSPWWAKAAILIQQLWAGSPYMFLIATGAIQALPAEVLEAAEVDGATPRQVFSKIKLPLVLMTLSPLLIASFAYNFSNFNAIYLLTGGGPLMTKAGGLAGSTDILISYTYKLAFNTGEGANYGLASTVSFLNFLLVAGLSLYGFSKSKTMENMN
jgi:arabinogalactan oligomer / maltooligosaccharide transport system permease protein